MDNIGERIKFVRKQKKLTQQKFADALGLKRNTVGGYEINTVDPSDRTISDICREFGVDEIWLRTGIGDPFTPETRDEQIAKILNEAVISNATARNRLIRALARLPDDAFPVIEEIIIETAKNLEAEKKSGPQTTQ